jgi:hypothetical protein
MKSLGWQRLRRHEVHSGEEVLLAQAASLQGEGRGDLSPSHRKAGPIASRFSLSC